MISFWLFILGIVAGTAGWGVTIWRASTWPGPRSLVLGMALFGVSIAGFLGSIIASAAGV